MKGGMQNGLPLKAKQEALKAAGMSFAHLKVDTTTKKTNPNLISSTAGGSAAGAAGAGGDGIDSEYFL